MIEDAMRLDDLQDKHQDHSWLWALNPAVDPVLPEAEWQCAVRLRLGCPQLSSEMLCTACGSKPLDLHGYHALCCAMYTKWHTK